MEAEDRHSPNDLASEQTVVGCFVSGSYRDDCIRFVEELKERLERARQTEQLART